MTGIEQQHDGRRHLGRAARAMSIGVAIALCAVLFSVVLATRVQAATLNVSTTGTDTMGCGMAGSPCLTVQYAITKATTGDTITIAAGTYTESLAMSKSLTIMGAGVGSTTIKAPATSLPANELGVKTLIDVTGGTTTVGISDLTISGVVTENSCADFIGVFVTGGATLNLTNAAVKDIRNSDASLFGCQQGSAIRFGSQPLMTIGKGSVNNVTVAGYQKNGVTVSNAGSVVSATNNTISPFAGVIGQIAPNGVQIGDGAQGTFTGNTISGNKCNVMPACGPNGNTADQSGGILIFNVSAGVTVSGNAISDNDAGVLLADDAPASTNLTISNNTFTANRYEAIYLLGGPTTISGNTFIGPSNIGIQLGTSSNPMLPATTGPVTNTNSSFIGSFNQRFTGPPPPNVYVNATFTGANGTDPDGTGPAIALGYDAFTTVQAGINAAAAGGTVTVSAGTYAELLTINKALTLKAADAMNKPTITAPNSTSNAAVITMASSGVTVNALNVIVNRPNATAGIVGGATVQVDLNNTAITNNTVTQTGNGGTFVNQFFGTASLGIALLDNSGGPSSIPPIVTVTNNVIAAGDSGTSLFGRGLWLRQTKGTVTGNTITAAIQDHLNQFASNGTTLIQGNTFNGAGLDLTEPNTPVTVNNNTFTPISNAFDQTLLVKHNYLGATVNVTNNTLTGFGKIGILVGNSNNTVVTGNTLTPAATLPVGTTSVVDILIDSKNPGTNVTPYQVGVVAKGNTLNGSATSAVGVSLGNGNKSLTPTYAVTLGGAAIGEVNIFNANLTNYIVVSNTAMQEVTADIDATNNSFGGVSPASATAAQIAAIEDKTFHYLDYGTPIGFVGFGNKAAVTGNTGNTVIQRAVDKIATGGTVFVSAGTFTEQITINKSLALTGASTATTIIQAPNAPLIPVTIGTGGEATQIYPIVYVTGATTTANVSGLTVNGIFAAPMPAPGPGANDRTLPRRNGAGGPGPRVVTNGCNTDFYGVFVGGSATLNLSNAAVKDVRDSDSSRYGCQQGHAIDFGYFSTGSPSRNQVGKGSVSTVAVTGYQKGGIVADGPGTQVSLTGNSVSPFPGLTSITAPNGIIISNQAQATVTGNTVSGNKCNAASCGPDGDRDSQSGGIIVFNVPNGLTISGNTLNDNDTGVTLYDDVPASTTLTIANNTFTADRYEAIYLLGGPTTVSGNTITGPGNIAIQLGKGDGMFFPATTGIVTYQNNTIMGYTKVGASAPMTPASVSPTGANTGQTTQLVVTGSNIPLGATVKVGSNTCANTNIPNSTTLACTLPPFAAGGMFNVVLTTADNVSVTLMNAFTVAATGPTITSLSPSTIPTTGNQRITIIGTGFLNGASVRVDGVRLDNTDVSFISDTRIDFTAPAHAAATAAVTVTNPGQVTSAMGSLTYGTINPVPPPTRPAGTSAPTSTHPAVALPTRSAAATPTGGAKPSPAPERR